MNRIDELHQDRVINSAWRARKRESSISRGSKLNGSSLFLFPFLETEPYPSLLLWVSPRLTPIHALLIPPLHCWWWKIAEERRFALQSCSLSLSLSLGNTWLPEAEDRIAELGNNRWGKVVHEFWKLVREGRMTRGINDETLMTMSGAWI